MKETIELSAPILIDGESVKSLGYDIDQITSEQFIEAETRAGDAAMRMGKMSAKVVELDAAFHYYLGVAAIVAANPSYAVEDIERIKGPDIMKVMRVGRNFMTSGAEEDEDEDSALAEDPDPEEELEAYLETQE